MVSGLERGLAQGLFGTLAGAEGIHSFRADLQELLNRVKPIGLTIPERSPD